MIIVVELISSREQDIEGAEMRLDGLKKQGMWWTRSIVHLFLRSRREGEAWEREQYFKVKWWLCMGEFGERHSSWEVMSRWMPPYSVSGNRIVFWGEDAELMVGLRKANVLAHLIERMNNMISKRHRKIVLKVIALVWKFVWQYCHLKEKWMKSSDIVKQEGLQAMSEVMSGGCCQFWKKWLCIHQLSEKRKSH